MTLELGILAGLALLMLAMPFVYGPAMIRRLGAATMLGDRQDLPDIRGWPSRAKRAHQNLAENLLPFAILVLVAQVAGRSNDWTAAAATFFLAGRLLHVGAYIADAGRLRAMGYFAALLSMGFIAVQLL